MIHLGQMNSHPQKTTMKDLCQTYVSQNLRMSCSNRQETVTVGVHGTRYRAALIGIEWMRFAAY